MLSVPSSAMFNLDARGLNCGTLYEKRRAGTLAVPSSGHLDGKTGLVSTQGLTNHIKSIKIKMERCTNYAQNLKL